MKTQSLILSGIFFIAFGCSNHKTEKVGNDLTYASLLGKVKTVRESSNIAIEKFGEITKGDICSISASDDIEELYSIYDKNGYLIEKYNYFFWKELTSKKTYDYDEKYNRIKITSTDSSGMLITNEIMKYDDKNILLEDDFFSEGKLSQKTTYLYNKEGKIADVNKYNSEGTLSGKEVFSYDNKGNCIEYINYQSDGSVGEKYINEYNFKGNNVKFSHYTFGNLNTIETCKYDNKNNVIERLKYDPDGKLFRTNTYKYNDKGNIIEQRRDKFIFLYKYDFDKQGNWIRKVVYSNENYDLKMTPQYLNERKIEYYD